MATVNSLPAKELDYNKEYELSLSSDSSPTSNESQQDFTAPSKDWRFYLILVSLSFITFTSSLDGSIIAIALPEITHELSATDDYIWIANSFLVAQTVVQPFCAQLCNVFGRRHPMIMLIAIFALGSGIAGGAKNSASIIAGRTIQGVGSGGIMMLVELIICDIAPLRERGRYLGYVMSSSAIGAITGPVIGGALATADWRWIFWMNIPFAGVTMLVMAVFLRLRHERTQVWTEALLRIDWIGNAIFIAALCALLVGLIFGGTVFPWSSWRVILLITLGVVGWICFHVYEWRPPKFCKEVSVPPHIFANRTSAAGFYINFVSSMLLQWVCFIWPIYFQGVRGASPMKAGTDFIPFEAFLIVTAAAGGSLLTKFGRYRPLHFIGFTLSTLGPGLNMMLSDTTTKAAWVGFQIVDATGRGLLLATVLPAIMASLSESDVASVTGMYSFLRSFGFVWGVTIPGMIFNSQFDHFSKEISDPSIRTALGSGKAYQYVSADYIHTLEPLVRGEVIRVYTRALRAVWIGAVVFGATGIIAVLVEKHIPLRTALDTKYGLEKQELQRDEEQQSVRISSTWQAPQSWRSSQAPENYTPP